MNSFADIAVANALQDFLDTNSLVNLSSTTQEAFTLYRPSLMGRMITLYSLPVEIPHNLGFQFDTVWKETSKIIEVLSKQITDETNGAYKEIKSPLNILYTPHYTDNNAIISLIPDETDDILKKREKLLELVTKVLTSHLVDGSITKIFSEPVSLHFLLSTAARSSGTGPQRQLFRNLSLHVIGHLLKSAPDNQRLKSALNSLKQQWKCMSTWEKVNTLHIIGLKLTSIEDPTHSALPLVKAFIADKALEWDPPCLRFALSQIIETREAQLKQEVSEKAIEEAEHLRNNLVEYSNQAVFLPFSEHLPILEIYCRNRSNSSRTSKSLQQELLEEKFICLRQCWNSLSLQEEAEALVNIGYSLYSIRDLEHPALPLARAFVKDKTLVWADDTVQKASSLIIELHIKMVQENNYNLGSPEVNFMLNVINKITEISESASRDEAEITLEELNELITNFPTT